MRRASFRSIFLVLALVFQAALGGNVLASFAGHHAGVSASQHCEVNGAGPQHQLPGEQKHDCLSCVFCAASALSSPLPLADVHMPALRVGVALLDHLGDESAPLAVIVDRAHQPRAPPAIS
ncbi:MAG: DUF2946 family protein [Methylocystis sp.]|jgi:hypothetical protein